MRRCPVQPSTPLGPDQVYVLLFLPRKCLSIYQRGASVKVNEGRSIKTKNLCDYLGETRGFSVTDLRAKDVRKPSPRGSASDHEPEGPRTPSDTGDDDNSVMYGTTTDWQPEKESLL
jgi:hypothetical protein